MIAKQFLRSLAIMDLEGDEFLKKFKSILKISIFDALGIESVEDV